MKGSTSERYASASLLSVSNEPGEPLSDSAASKWTAGLIGLIEGRGFSERFETTPTPDQKIVVVTSGSMKLDVMRKGVWRSAVRRTGSIGLTAADHNDSLRWTALGATDSFETAHIFLPQALIDRAADSLRRVGKKVRSEPANASAVYDGVISKLAFALVAAHKSQESDLLASSIMQALAFRLTSMENRWEEASESHYSGSLRGAQLARLLEFMRCYCTQDLTLEQLAAEAGLSQFHLIRAFKTSVGTSPHRHLVRLRLEKAQQLLRDPGRPIAEIAAVCGFSSAAHLTKAFHTRFSETPSRFRQGLHS